MVGKIFIDHFHNLIALASRWRAAGLAREALQRRNKIPFHCRFLVSHF
jgi:hypothetical protein